MAKIALWTGLDRTELGEVRKLRAVQATIEKLEAAQRGKVTPFLAQLRRERQRLVRQAESERKYALRRFHREA